MPPPNLIRKTYDHHHNATNIINNLGKDKKSSHHHQHHQHHQHHLRNHNQPQLKFKRTDVAPRAHRKQASSGV